jgi:hypothetical protein
MCCTCDEHHRSPRTDYTGIPFLSFLRKCCGLTFYFFKPNDPRIVERKDTPIQSSETPPPSAGDDSSKPKKTVSYYLADGVYGSFNNIFFDHATPLPNVLPKVISSFVFDSLKFKTFF